MIDLDRQTTASSVSRRMAAIAVMLGTLLLSVPTADAKRPGDDDNQPSAARHSRSSAAEARSNSSRQPQRDWSPRREATISHSASPQPRSLPVPSAVRSAPVPTPPRFGPPVEHRLAPTLPSVTMPKVTAPRELIPRTGDSRNTFNDRTDSSRDGKSNRSDARQVEELRRQADWLRKQTSAPKAAPVPPPVLPKRPEADSLGRKTPAQIDSRAIAPPRIIKPELPHAPKLQMIAKESILAKELKDAPASVRPERSDLPELRKNHGEPGPTVAPVQTSQKTLATPKADIHDLNRMRFTERLKAGHLDRLTTGQVAQKIKLGEQYRLAQQGDVARRLELHKQISSVDHATNIHNATNVHNVTKAAGVQHGAIDGPSIYGHNWHHGRISPHYSHDCLSFHYWGPAHFAGPCWYPRWHPWVKWSWHHHCHPFWDPRPIWCRPVIYEPCPAWVWWEPPVWEPLPVVVCGTWVDVPPAVAAVSYDLQLLAVRFVDPGHPEQNLGPRYRVWLRNNSSQPLTQPFNVMLFAGNDDRMAADLPQAGVRVAAIEAGDIQSVDIRLPIEVYAMGRDAAGNPAPFSTLHVLADANREIPEMTRTNNGAHLARADILPVDPAAFEVAPQEAVAGGEVVLAGEGFGPRPGRVLVHMAGLELEGEVLGWYDLGVRVALPKVPLAGATEAELIVIRGDGAAANPLKIRIAPMKPDFE